MAGEIAVQFEAGKTVYSQVFNRTSGFAWNGSAFEAYSSASGNQNSYVVALTELGTASARYTGNFPSAIGPGTYDVVAKQRVSTPYLETDPTIGVGQVEWTGTIAAPLSDTATSGQVSRFVPMAITRGVAISGFMFPMKSSADHITAFVSGNLSGQVSRDGGSFGALQSGAFSEVGLGWYKVNLTSGDLLATTVALNFSAVNLSGGAADPVLFGFITNRTSGY